MNEREFHIDTDTLNIVATIGYVYGLITAIKELYTEGGDLINNILMAVFTPIGAALFFGIVYIIFAAIWYSMTEKIKNINTLTLLTVVAGTIIGVIVAVNCVGERSTSKQSIIESVYADGYDDGLDGEYNEYYYDEVYMDEYGQEEPDLHDE